MCLCITILRFSPYFSNSSYYYFWNKLCKFGMYIEDRSVLNFKTASAIVTLSRKKKNRQVILVGSSASLTDESAVLSFREKIGVSGGENDAPQKSWKSQITYRKFRISVRLRQNIFRRGSPTESTECSPTATSRKDTAWRFLGSRFVQLRKNRISR